MGAALDEDGDSADGTGIDFAHGQEQRAQLDALSWLM